MLKNLEFIEAMILVELLTAKKIAMFFSAQL